MIRTAIVTIVLAAMPAHAEWTAANPSVAEAAKEPRVAAVLAEIAALDTAIVNGDKAGFTSRFAANAMVNSPFNNVVTAAVAAQRFQAGIISYKYLRRSVEYAAARGNDEVVIMGAETYEPRAGAPAAGQILTRRFTDIWQRDGNSWKLSLRQATVIGANAPVLPTPAPEAK